MLDAVRRIFMPCASMTTGCKSQRPNTRPFSAYTPRALRLSGEFWLETKHRRDKANAEITQGVRGGGAVNTYSCAENLTAPVPVA